MYGNTGAGDNHHTKWPKSLYYYFVLLWLWLSISTRVIVPCSENRGNRQISGDMNPLHSLDEGKASDELWRVQQMFMWEQWMLTLVGIVGLGYRCSTVIFQLLVTIPSLMRENPDRVLTRNTPPVGVWQHKHLRLISGAWTQGLWC
jgi:hypothetical protein